MACRRERNVDVIHRQGLVDIDIDVDVNREGVLPEREAAELASVANFELAVSDTGAQNRRPSYAPGKIEHKL